MNAQRRQRYQRGAKDKVYAERLAAEEKVGMSTTTNATTSNATTTTTATATAINNDNNNDNNNHGGGGEHSNKQKQGAATRTTTKREKVSKKQPTMKKGDERGGGVTRMKIPPGWPFVNSTLSTSSGGSSSNGGAKKRGRKRKNSACAASVRNDGGNEEGNRNTTTMKGRKKNDRHDNATTTSLPSSSFSSSSSKSNTTTAVGTQKRRPRGQSQRAITTAEVPPMVSDKMNGSSSSFSSSFKSNSTSSSSSTSSRRRRRSNRHSTNPSTTTTTTVKNETNNNNNNSNNKNKWTCVRCTLLNTSRRKKCQVCHAPRCVTDDSAVVVDGIGIGGGGGEGISGGEGEDISPPSASCVDKSGTSSSSSSSDTTTNGNEIIESKESKEVEATIPKKNNDSLDYYTSVNVRLTVSNANVYNDNDDVPTSTMARPSDGGKEDEEKQQHQQQQQLHLVDTTNTMALSAIVPTSFLLQGEDEQVNENDEDIIHCNSEPVVKMDETNDPEPVVKTEETNDSMLLDTAVADTSMNETENEECEQQHEQQHLESQSQSQTSIQSEFSAMIDSYRTTPPSSLSVPPPINNSVVVRNEPQQQEEEHVEEGLSIQQQQQQQSLSQSSSSSSVQSEFSAMIDATARQQKLSRLQQQEQEMELPNDNDPVVQDCSDQTTKQAAAQESENGQFTDNNPDQFHSIDDGGAEDVQAPEVPPSAHPLQQQQEEEEQQIQSQQPPSNFKQWLQKRKESRREKKQHRKRSKSTTENDSQGQHDTEGNDDIEINSEVTTVVVRLILSDRECNDATTIDEDDLASRHNNSNVLSAIVSKSIFSWKDELIGITNVDAREDVADADGDNIDDAGDCNHPCLKEEDGVEQQAPFLHENQADSAAQVADEDTCGDVEQLSFPMKESNDDLIVRNSPTSKAKDDTHQQEGVLSHSKEEKTPICNTNEQCPSTQGSSSSVHSHFPMTQQLPDFDYYTQASIESPVIEKRDEKSSLDSTRQNQEESESRREEEHDMTSSVSGSAKHCSNEYIIDKKQDKSSIDTSAEPLGKENLSIHSHTDNSNIDDMTRQPLQHITTMPNAAENVKTTNIDQFVEYDEPYNPPSTGFGFTSAGSGKMIAVDEEELAKAAKVLADDTQKSSVLDGNEYDEPYNPPSTGFGFTSAGSGKMIAVDEEELAKAAKVLADDTQKSSVLDDIEYVEPYNPPSTGFGFTSAGSGKMIAVDDEEFAKAAKVLADDSQKSSVCDHDQDYNEHDEHHDKSCFPLSSGLGVSNVGSGKAIAVGDEDLVKAANVLEDDTPKIDQNDDDFCNSTQLDNLLGEDDSGYGKNTQKVRFSLGGSTTDVFSEENILASALSRVPTDHAIQSIITPAKGFELHEDLPEGGLDSKPSVACESKDRANIVTENKDKTAVPKCREDEIGRFSSSPYNSNAYTPLNVTNRLDSFQSEIKSKRLFEKTVSAEITMRQQVNGDRASVTLNADIAHSTKVTLRQLAERCQMETEWDKCKDAGVSDVVLKLTSVNALKLRFSEDEGVPSFFFGQTAPPGCNYVGSVDDINKWMQQQGFDESLFTKKWVQNHYRWIVWKLGAMERRFPSQLSGRYLTYQHVLLQMKSRYEKELCSAKRPSVRKILNRDVSASAPIVLCVSQILRFRSKGSQEAGKSTVIEEIRLELTDGWYGVPAVIDNILQTLVANEKIRVGSKLLICNARLAGSDEGVDPLDESYSSEKRTCPLFLKITTNNTRLAKWDAKLGFISPKMSGITIKSFRDVYPGGGNIPSIDLVICKRYPKMFLEQMTTGEKQIPISTHLTEGEEASRRSEYDLKKQRAGEKHADAVHSECVKELDEDAPSKWKEMVMSISPEEYYEKLSPTEKKVVDDWNERRPVLLQSMVSKFIGDLRDECLPERKSNPYVKTLVKTFHRHHRAASTQASAELTVWRVSDEQFDLLKEGTVLRMTNLGIKEKSRDGFLQLRAGPETVMVPLSEDSKRQLSRSGYEERRPKSLIKINLMSKKMDTCRLSNEVDVVACVAQIRQLGDNSTAIYLTDETGLALKLTRNHNAHNTDPFQIGNAKTDTVVSFCNIQITGFDEIEQCATGTWGLFSCKTNRIDSRHEELLLWCRSQCGADTIGAVRSRLEAGIPVVGGLSNRHQISIGYILAILEEGGCNDFQRRMKAAIDYGEAVPLVADFPLHLIQRTISLLQSNESSEFAQRADLCDIPSLNAYFLNNQKLLHFSFEVVSCYGGDSSTLRITHVSLANVDALSRLIMA